MAAAFMNFPNVCRLLIEHGARVESVDSAGATALHLALSNGSNTTNHEQVVKLLLDENADVNMCDMNGRYERIAIFRTKIVIFRNCLHLAAYHNNAQLKLILDKVHSVDAQV